MKSIIRLCYPTANNEVSSHELEREVARPDTDEQHFIRPRPSPVEVRLPQGDQGGLPPELRQVRRPAAEEIGQGRYEGFDEQESCSTDVCHRGEGIDPGKGYPTAGKGKSRSEEVAPY